MGLLKGPIETGMVKHPEMRFAPETVIEPNSLMFYNPLLLFPNPGPLACDYPPNIGSSTQGETPNPVPISLQVTLPNHVPRFSFILAQGHREVRFLRLM